MHGLSNMIDNWKDEQVSADDANSGSTSNSAQMLVLIPSAITTTLEEESALCAKKDLIIDKLNSLLKKLGHENEDRNATDQAAYEAKQAALGAWLDGNNSHKYSKYKTNAKQAAIAAWLESTMTRKILKSIHVLTFT